MIRIAFGAAIGAGLLVFAAAPASAQIVASQTRCNDLGTCSTGATTTYIGDTGGRAYRNGLVFNTTGAQAATTISITFSPTGQFRTDGAAETLGLFEYSGDYGAITSGSGGVAAYNDLGDGLLYGTFGMTASDGTPMPSVTIDLSQDFIDAYNASIGTTNEVIIGLSNLTNFQGGLADGFWAAGGVATATLNVNAPEPGAWAMMIGGFGVAGGALRARRRRKLAAA